METEHKGSIHIAYFEFNAFKYDEHASDLCRDKNRSASINKYVATNTPKAKHRYIALHSRTISWYRYSKEYHCIDR